MADQKKDQPVKDDKKDEQPPVQVLIPGDKKTFKRRGVEKRG